MNGLCGKVQSKHILFATEEKQQESCNVAIWCVVPEGYVQRQEIHVLHSAGYFDHVVCF